MIMKTFRVLATLGFVLLAAGCKESVTEPPPVESTLPIHTITNIPADTGSVAKYTYFSLRDSSIITGSDTATVKWDLAFAATTIRTNSGTSGPGQGGAIVLSGTDFDTVSQAMASGYSVDTSATKLAITTGSDKGWYHYDFATNIITPIAGRVLIIRTADGRYAKMQIVSYYKDAPVTPTQNDISRFYTFRYVFQPDGSTTLR